VIGEIESQLEALKRQARQAVRYRNLSGDIRRAEAAVFHLRWKAAEKARAEAEDELSASRSGAAERATEQAEAAKNQAIAADRMPKLRDEAAAAAAVVQRLRLAGESLDAEQKRVSERLDALGRHLAELGEDIARETRMADENESALARLSDEERELASANAGADEREQEAGQRVERAAAALRESEDKLDRLTRQHADLAAARKQLEQSVADARRRSERLQADRDSVRARVDDLTARSGDASALGEMTAALERARTGEETAETEAGTAEETATAMRNAVDLARNAVDTARAALAEVRQTAGRIETEQKTLQRLLTVASSSDAPLIDEVEVDAGFEAALAAAFGDDLDAPAETDASVHWRVVRDSAWSASRATCGGGTDMSLLPKPTARQPGGWKAATASANSAPKPRRREQGSRPAPAIWKPPRKPTTTRGMRRTRRVRRRMRLVSACATHDRQSNARVRRTPKPRPMPRASPRRCRDCRRIWPGSTPKSARTRVRSGSPSMRWPRRPRSMRSTAIWNPCGLTWQPAARGWRKPARWRRT